MMRPSRVPAAWRGGEVVHLEEVFEHVRVGRPALHLVEHG